MSSTGAHSGSDTVYLSPRTGKQRHTTLTQGMCGDVCCGDVCCGDVCCGDV